MLERVRSLLRGFMHRAEPPPSAYPFRGECGRCAMCGRLLSRDDDPLSGDCGGDCWGCIGKIEADMGWEPSVEFVQIEIRDGLRFTDGTPRPLSGPA